MADELKHTETDIKVAENKDTSQLDRSDSDRDLDDAGLEGDEKIDLNSNVSGRIKNPLAHIPKHRLLRDVEEFANKNGLDDILPNLQKGALIAKDPANFETVEGITEEEIEVIRDEVVHKWRQPRPLYYTIILCSIGAAVQGWDQTGSNGANLSFPDAFNISDREGTPNAHIHQWLVGLVNAGPYIGSAFLGCWLSDPFNDFFGRRGAIFISAVFCVLPPIGSAVSQNWEQLLITRLLLGIGMGAKASTVPIFCAENTPASVRGGLVMSWQLWTAFGIFLGFSANLAVKDTGDISWRLQLGSAFIPAVPLLLGSSRPVLYLLPD
ncbi:arabinose-proton symporter [Coccidioides immitis RMSCC 3703]|uniref:Arabinose-proton symporter n=1 Tax=Coccidioides immitis RMSCC 3703 TaxID=454286 RepID=A0A0J8R7Q2_COCIT|nr:arabinose-proton symporter [Coccidioides immitis RMSCC 3703]